MDHRKLAAALVAVIFTITALPVFADDMDNNANNTNLIKTLEDGSYYETVITSERVPSAMTTLSRAAKTKKTAFSKTKTKITARSKTTYHRTKNGKVLWYVKVTGTFTYGNGHSKCIRSSVKAVSKSKNWKIIRKSADKYDNKAVAEATAKKITRKSQVNSMHVSLSCTSSGNFY